MAERISIDPTELRTHQASLDASGKKVVAAAEDLRASTAGIAPGGAGGLDAEEVNRKYYDAAQGLLDATGSVGELLESLGGSVGQFADATEQQELARTLATLEQDPYPVNGDVKLWTRAGSVLGNPGRVAGPVIVP